MISAKSARYLEDVHRFETDVSANPSPRLRGGFERCSNHATCQIREGAEDMARLDRIERLANSRLSFSQQLDLVCSDPRKTRVLNAIARVLFGAPQSTWGPEEKRIARALTSGASPGSLWASQEGIGADLYDLTLATSAFRTLGVHGLLTRKAKLPVVTVKPGYEFILIGSQGTALTADTTLAGSAVSIEANTIGTLIEQSLEHREDTDTDFARVLLALISEAVASGIDHAAFNGAGAADAVDGGWTGLFQDAAIGAAEAGAGNVTAQTLDVADFARCVGTVAAATLQRPCRWWLHPAFLPLVATIKDGSENLFKKPATAGDDWMCLGFPVTWTSAAPSTNAAGQKIAAFGDGRAYAVGVLVDFELRQNFGRKFAEGIAQIRCLARVACKTRDATGLATLKLASA